MENNKYCPSPDAFTCPYYDMATGKCSLEDPWEDCSDYAVFADEYHDEDEEEEE